MIRKIMVAVGDGPERDVPIRYADDLASRMGAELYAVHVVQKSISLAVKSVEWELEREYNLEMKQVRKVLEELCSDTLSGIKFKTVVHETPAQALLEEARKGDYDLVVLGDRDKNRIHKIIIGSTSSRMAHHSRRPIIVVKDYRKLEHMLLCVDGSVTAAKASFFAATMARKLRVGVTILHVAEGEVNQAVVDRIISRELNIIKGGGVTADHKVRRGDPAEEIVSETREGDYGLVVLGYRGTASFKEFLLGDVVAKVLRDSFCPTLIYRTK